MIQAQTLVQHAPPGLAAGHELAGRALSELQHVLHEEQRVLSVAASGQPEPAAELKQLAAQRQQLLSQIGSLISGLGAEPVLPAGPAGPAQARPRPWQLLREGLEAAAALNQDNGLLAGRRIDYLRSRQAGLASAAGLSAPYRRDGSTAPQHAAPAARAVA